MKLHRNAKTTPTSRLELVRRTVDDGWRYQAVADGYGVSVRTVAKWVQRFRQLGAAGLEDGSSRPQQTPHITYILERLPRVTGRGGFRPGVNARRCSAVEPAPVDGEGAHAVEGRGLAIDGAGGRPGWSHW